MATGFNMSNHAGFQLDPLIDSEEDVLEIRRRALCLLMEGRVIMECSGEGNESKREFVAPISEILAETRRFLKLINPQKYGHTVRQSRQIRFG